MCASGPSPHLTPVQVLCVYMCSVCVYVCVCVYMCCRSLSLTPLLVLCEYTCSACMYVHLCVCVCVCVCYGSPLPSHSLPFWKVSVCTCSACMHVSFTCAASLSPFNSPPFWYYECIYVVYACVCPCAYAFCRSLPPSDPLVFCYYVLICAVCVCMCVFVRVCVPQIPLFFSFSPL